MRASPFAWGEFLPMRGWPTRWEVNGSCGVGPRVAMVLVELLHRRSVVALWVAGRHAVLPQASRGQGKLVVGGGNTGGGSVWRWRRHGRGDCCAARFVEA